MSNHKLKERYGLFTAICMVVGIVIGSGVFFKAQDILNYTDGNILLGVLAWVIGGIVMIICAFNFANFATKYVKVNGIVDYAEAAVGPRYAYMTGWFLSTIFFPAMTSVLAWVSAPPCFPRRFRRRSHGTASRGQWRRIRFDPR